jgi:hypothetical protein
MTRVNRSADLLEHDHLSVIERSTLDSGAILDQTSKAICRVVDDLQAHARLPNNRHKTRARFVFSFCLQVPPNFQQNHRESSPFQFRFRSRWRSSLWYCALIPEDALEIRRGPQRQKIKLRYC